MARSYAPEALFVLVRLMRGAKSEKIRHDAAVSVLDRGLGRPWQGDAPTEDEASEMDSIADEALEAFLDA
jgi:hypothetical protein